VSERRRRRRRRRRKRRKREDNRKHVTVGFQGPIRGLSSEIMDDCLSTK
jgi:hypothetical protein